MDNGQWTWQKLSEEKKIKRMNQNPNSGRIPKASQNVKDRKYQIEETEDSMTVGVFFSIPSDQVL